MSQVKGGHTRTKTAQRMQDGKLNYKHFGSLDKVRLYPAYFKQSCQENNHFARKYFSKEKDIVRRKSVVIEDDIDFSELLLVGIVNCNSEQEKGIHIK